MANRRSGTLRFYGTPAEEGGAGKVYMLRAGLFDDVDAVVTMHPGDRNAASASSTLANITGKFRFRGLSAHASTAPDRGRSALDGVEAMNAMVNLMREHVPSDARIHYVITNGGRAPNVVPDFAESYYYARHNDMRVVESIWERIMNAARGAAMGTGTTMELELTGAVWNVLPNSYLVGLMQENLKRVGGYESRQAERQFADGIRKSLDGELPPIDSANGTFSPDAGIGSASTDLGDVSWHPADRAADGGHVGPRYTGPQLAGGSSRRRHVDRHQGHGGCGQVDDADGDGSLYRPVAPREGARRVRPAPRPELRPPTHLADRKPALDYRK